jgi:PadR family transcriptional regulator, regulatory protein PadR
VLGELEQIVLLAVLRGGEAAYGVSILREIEQEAERTLTLATIYKTLGRLEEKGFVASRVGDPTPTRGGRRKRFYVITPLGRQSLEGALTALRRMSRGLEIGLDVP